MKSVYSFTIGYRVDDVSIGLRLWGMISSRGALDVDMVSSVNQFRAFEVDGFARVVFIGSQRDSFGGIDD